MLVLEVASLCNGGYCLATFPSKSRQLRIVCAAGKTIESSSGSGTKRFAFGGTGKKKEEENDDEESNGAINFGTQLLNFGSKKNNKLATTSSSAKGGSKKDLSLSLGLLRRAPDARTVFVAGATGQIGARISQQLLRGGFTVRGGVRDLSFAQQLAEFATQYGVSGKKNRSLWRDFSAFSGKPAQVISRDEARKINAVEFDFKDVESIAKAMGNAGKVVITVGPNEDGPKGRVSAKDALQVVEAASIANVGHVVVVSEAGGSASSSGPLAAISDFFSKLFSKDAEVTTDSLLDSVVDTNLRFTFVKVSSTDGVDDFSPDGDNLVLLSEGTYNQGTGKVSKSQLASVVAGIFANISIAENKVIEVATMGSGASKPIDELLSSIPEDGRRAALAEAKAKAEAEERERKNREQAEAEAKKALDEAKKAAALAGELEEEAKKLARQEQQAVANAEKAKQKAKAAAASLDDLGAKVKEFGASISETSQNSFGNFFKRGAVDDDDQEEEEEEEEKPKFGIGSLFKGKDTEQQPAAPVRIPTPPSRSTNKVSTSKPSASRSRTKPRPSPPTPKPPTKKQESPGGTKNVLGGLFKQDTLYVDE